MSGLNQFELVQVSIFIMMNWTKPKQAVQSSSVQSGSVHQFVVWFASSEPNHANTRLARGCHIIEVCEVAKCSLLLYNQRDRGQVQRKQETRF